MSRSHAKFRNPGSEDLRNALSAWPVPARGGQPGADVQAALNVRDSELADERAWDAFAAGSAAPGVSDRLAPAEPGRAELTEKLAHQELAELGGAAIQGAGHLPHQAARRQ